MTKNAFKRTPLHRALKGRNENTVRIFYEYYQQTLEQNVLKKILFFDELDYFNYGNHKKEKLVDELRTLAAKNFGEEAVEKMIKNNIPI